LIHLLKGNRFIIVKITAISLCEILKDIAPLYILKKTELEMKLKSVIKK